MQDVHRINELTLKYRNGTITPEEHEELDEWLNAADGDLNRLRFEERLREENVLEGLGILHEADERMKANADNIPWSTLVAEEEPETKVRPMVWRRLAIAVVAVITVSAITLLILRNEFIHTEPGKNTTPQMVSSDIAPGSDKAILRLADGSTLLLDSLTTGSVTDRSGAHFIKTSDGSITYAAADPAAQATYNTIETPLGGQFNVVLPDGSKVWLNAGSSLRYPTVFNDRERIVELSGEAYLEVAKNPSRPFKVQVNNLSVTVLGTHFNINAYANEGSVKTTLLEGSVAVSEGAKSVTIAPGEQAQFQAGLLTINHHADTESVTAWKDGYFSFAGADIEAVMRVLQRWYNIDVEYRGVRSSYRIDGSVNRNNNISVVLKILENAGYRFDINGKTIIVRP